MIGFQGALTPLVFHHHANTAMPGELARIFRFFLALALPSMLCLGVFSRELVWLFATPEYYAAWSIIPFLSFGLLFSNLYIFTPGLFIRNRTPTVAAINILAAISNLALNLTLIPILGIVGASLATFLSAFAEFAPYFAFSQRLYPVPHDLKRLLLALGTTALIIFAALSIGDKEAHLTWQGVILNLVFSAVGSLMVARVLLGSAELAAISKILTTKWLPKN